MRGIKKLANKKTVPAWLGFAKLEWLFAAIFVVAGLSFIIITPPGWNTDEIDHTFRVFQLSQGDILSEQVTAPNGLKAFGGQIPTNFIELYNQTGVRAPGAATDVTKKLNGLYHQQPQLTHLKDDGRRTTINFSGAALYSPIAYAVYIPEFWIGKLLSLPFFWIVIAARVVGLLVTCAAFFWAIRYIPVGKWVICAVGLLPVTVVQASSVGADAPQLAISVLYLALATRLLYRARPRAIDFMWLAVLGATLGLTKMVYVPMVLLLFLLPLLRKDCRNRRQWAYIAITALVTVIPGLVWLHLVSYIDINSNPQADFVLQKAFVLHHPILYAKVLYHTYLTNQSPSLNNLLGTSIWASAPLPAIFGYAGIGVLAASTVVQTSREQTLRVLTGIKRRFWRIGLGLTSVIISILIGTALYIYSTTLHQSTIVGIQSRYFIPILPMILLMFYGNPVQRQRSVKAGIIIASCIILAGAWLAAYDRMYQVLPLILQ